MPVYNAGRYLADAIESILAQSFEDFELIIINDGSTDESPLVIQSYLDQRIKFINHKFNSGLVAALNTGLQSATGKYIARMDQDDISFPGRLQMQYNYMEQHPDCVLLGTQVKVIGENKLSKMYTVSNELKASLLFGTSFAHPSVMMRASILKNKHIAYDEQFKHAEDYGLWTQLAMCGEIANLEEVCLEYRKHPSQYTKVFSDGMLKATRKIRSLYLDKLGAAVSIEEKQMLNEIAEKQIDYTNEEQINNIGYFLSHLPKKITNSEIHQKATKKIAYSHWKYICSERQKIGCNSYGIFLSNPLAKSLNDLKTHAWFLKETVKPKLG